MLSTINEAKDSSAIENIITTHDELYQAIERFRRFKILQLRKLSITVLLLWHWL